MVGSKKNEKVLDVACGNGVLTFKISERGSQVHGVDLSEDAIKSAINFARHKDLNCEFKVGDAHDLPYPDEYFDKIVCSSSLEHFTDDIKALKEMHRVLKSNGRVFLTTDSFNYPISKELKEKHKKLAHVVNYYSKKELKKALENAGFKMKRSKYLLNSPLTSFFFIN